MTRRRHSILTIGSLAAFLFVLTTTLVFAADDGKKQYVPLVGIPGLTDKQNPSIAAYINSIYLFTITVGAIIGVIKIGMAGVKYSMSDVITDKSEARKDILGVFMGLAILLIPFVVLNTIYSGLTNLDVLENKNVKVDLKPSGGADPSTQTSGQDFIASLPKPPFDSNGICQEGYDSSSADGASCATTCADQCASLGGTATRISTDPATGCGKIRCLK
ncbi:MAG TPA: hypothetical protein VFS75_01600 [Candidatus Paceibacterota bacterium]|nr:hypothetical protein [Candidatus Paceibacterota bacterium]